MFTKSKTSVKNTMSREEYEKTLKSLQDQIEELKKVEVVDDKPKKGEIWMPKHKSSYYYICSDYQISGTINYRGSAIDSRFMECSNFYETRDKAEYQANVQKYTNLFRKYVEEHSEPIKWINGSNYKYCIYYDYNYGTIEFTFETTYKQQGTIYASSEQVLKDAIEFVGKDNVIKYVLGVENV